jgi:EAL domain-containing protein (putative c-di-GMP-specific phosphodiesterase class I)
MEVVAEGVETLGQMDILREMRCTSLQGWLFGRPVDLAELTAVLAAFDPSLLDSVPDPNLDRDVHTVGRLG